jgi:hypothetical protein
MQNDATAHHLVVTLGVCVESQRHLRAEWECFPANYQPSPWIQSKRLALTSCGAGQALRALNQDLMSALAYPAAGRATPRVPARRAGVQTCVIRTVPQLTLLMAEGDACRPVRLVERQRRQLLVRQEIQRQWLFWLWLWRWLWLWVWLCGAAIPHDEQYQPANPRKLLQAHRRDVGPLVDRHAREG